MCILGKGQDTEKTYENTTKSTCRGSVPLKNDPFSPLLARSSRRVFTSFNLYNRSISLLQYRLPGKQPSIVRTEISHEHIALDTISGHCSWLSVRPVLSVRISLGNMTETWGPLQVLSRGNVDMTRQRDDSAHIPHYTDSLFSDRNPRALDLVNIRYVEHMGVILLPYFYQPNLP